MVNEVTTDKLDPGEIRFVDHYIPPLEAGTYTIKVEQSLSGSGAQPVSPAEASFLETQEFKVSGAHFRLDPADIQQMYPPANSKGRFEDDLPHIILTRRTLPWERSPAKDQKTPWMALLLFDPSEIVPPGGGTNQDGQGANPTGVFTIEAGKLEHPEAGVLTGYEPNDLDESERSLKCQVFDITPDTFETLIPKRTELMYLAHCRGVQMDEKAVPGPDVPGAQLPTGNGTDWYSVVVGGRFPGSPQAGEKTGQLNVVHLVSLEGFAQYLNDDLPTSLPSDTRFIRLVSLARWVFTCLPELGEEFSVLMEGLAKGDTTFQLPVKKPAGTADEDSQFAFRMIATGYAPLSYHTRVGAETFAWYRGPFTPQQVPPFPSDRPPFFYASQAAIYDKVHGLFDLSYATAWEIGRLLALSDQRFGKRLLNRRRKAHQLIDLLEERRGQHSPNESLTQKVVSAQYKELTAGNLVSDSVISYMVGDFAKNIEPSIWEQKPKTPRMSDQQPPSSRADSPAPANLSGRYQESEVQQFLKEMDGEELEQISEWLAKLYLLYGVPFHHLAPDEGFLPAESIRFFYLDRNWLDMLLDGALSIGMHSSRDQEYQKLMYPAITGRVHERIQTMRDSLLDKNNDHPENSGGRNSDLPLAGLLLRSAVVPGWPGLEVRAYRRSAGDKGEGLIGLLRMDRLSADVLLCIFNEVPARVELTEPKEGLHFGLEENGKIGLRFVSGPETGNPVKGFPPEEGLLPIERDDKRRLKFQDMLKRMAGKFKLDPKEFGPAAFALQMVKVPQQMVFTTEGNHDNPSV